MATLWELKQDALGAQQTADARRKRAIALAVGGGEFNDLELGETIRAAAAVKQYTESIKTLYDAATFLNSSRCDDVLLHAFANEMSTAVCRAFAARASTRPARPVVTREDVLGDAPADPAS